MATRRNQSTKEEAVPVAETEVVVEKAKRRGRTVSPLIKATREYEAAQKKAQKARKALARVQPLIDSLSDLEAEEKKAFDALQGVLSAL